MTLCRCWYLFIAYRWDATIAQHSTAAIGSFASIQTEEFDGFTNSHLSSSMKSPAEALPLPDGAATNHDWSSSLAPNSDLFTLPPPPPLLLPLRVRWWRCGSGEALEPVADSGRLCSDRGAHCPLPDGGDASAKAKISMMSSDSRSAHTEQPTAPQFLYDGIDSDLADAAGFDVAPLCQCEAAAGDEIQRRPEATEADTPPDQIGHPLDITRPSLAGYMRELKLYIKPIEAETRTLDAVDVRNRNLLRAQQKVVPVKLLQRRCQEFVLAGLAVPALNRAFLPRSSRRHRRGCQRRRSSRRGWCGGCCNWLRRCGLPWWILPLPLQQPQHAVEDMIGVALHAASVLGWVD